MGHRPYSFYWELWSLSLVRAETIANSSDEEILGALFRRASGFPIQRASENIGDITVTYNNSSNGYIHLREFSLFSLFHSIAFQV